MARGRFLSATVNTDRRLNALSVEAALIYLMAIPYLDRDGLMHGDPDIVQGSVCPKRRRLELDSIIREWIASGLVLQYECDEGPVLWFKGFTKNQMGMHYDREAPSRFPPPPGYHSENTKDRYGLFPDDIADAPAQTPAAPLPQASDVPILPAADLLPQPSDATPDLIRTLSGPHPAEVKVEDQVQVEEGEIARACVTEPPTPESPPPVAKSIGPLPEHLARMVEQANGHDTHYRPRVQVIADAYMDQARQLGISPPSFSARISALASCVGKGSYIDAADDDAGTLNSLKSGVLTLHKLGFGSEADYRQLCESFAAANEWMDTPVPTLRQLLDHAGKVKDGVATKTKSRPPKPNAKGEYDFPTRAAAQAVAAQYPDIRNRVTVKGTRLSV